MKYRLTAQADADIAGILRSTRKMFGPQQMLAYSDIIHGGIEMVAADPSRATSRTQGDLGDSVKSFHLQHVQGRRTSASHQLFFLEKTTPMGADEVVILRILHDKMVPRRRLARALRDEEVPSEPSSGPRI